MKMVWLLTSISIKEYPEEQIPQSLIYLITDQMRLPVHFQKLHLQVLQKILWQIPTQWQSQVHWVALVQQFNCTIRSQEEPGRLQQLA